MDIRQLRYFIAIAEEGSLSAAAPRLNVAQPSLSQHVLALERLLGVKLMERTPRGVSLTASGEILLSHAREVTQAMDRAIEAVRQSGATRRARSASACRARFRWCFRCRSPRRCGWRCPGCGCGRSTP